MIGHEAVRVDRVASHLMELFQDSNALLPELDVEKKRFSACRSNRDREDLAVFTVDRIR